VCKRYVYTPLVQSISNRAHYDMYVKVAYDNFDNKRRYDDYDDEVLFAFLVAALLIR